VGVFLGLKPQAESYPFGINSDNPLRDRASFATVDKIDSTSLSHHPLEDEDENDFGLIALYRRLRLLIYQERLHPGKNFRRHERHYRCDSLTVLQS
jgi:hypothetical protein